MPGAQEPETAVTTPTRFVEGGGTRFAHRRLGAGSATPLVVLQHFLGNLDTLDPAVVDPLSTQREVIFFDTTGVAGSTGRPRETVAEMAQDAVAFIAALGLPVVDVCGISLGGFVAQQLALERPDLVRKVIVVGSGPRSGPGMERVSDHVRELFFGDFTPTEARWVPLFFGESPASRASGQAYLQRVLERADRDAPFSPEAAAAHGAAARGWTRAGQDQNYLRRIEQPVLVVNGSDDIVYRTENSYRLQQALPNAQLIIYPDSSHGSIFQYPELFTAEAALFLDR